MYNFKSRNCGVLNVYLSPEQERVFEKLDIRNRESMFNLGFIAPKQVADYHCIKCNETFDEHPSAEIYIEQVGGGELTTSVFYRCGHCSEIVHYDYLKTPENIPVEFIKLDKTGDFKSPTKKSIDDLLIKVLNMAKNGEGGDMNQQTYFGNLEVAQRWADKIDYDISPNVNELGEVFRVNYVKKLESELPELVGEIAEMDYGFSLDGEDDCGCTHYEGTGLSSKMDRLFETLEVVTPQNTETNREIIRIFEAYCRMDI